MMQRLARRRLFLFVVLLALAALVAQLNRTQLWEDREVYAGWRVQHHVMLGSCRLLDDARKRQAWGWGDDCAAALQRARREAGLTPASRHLVLLLHGMGRSPFLFRDMEAALRADGYEAVAISYPSLTRDIAGHAAQLEHLLERAADVDRVSFVTHSLGGLVVRQLLAGEGRREESDWRGHIALGRIVMIAPPNQGSDLAEALGSLAPFHWIGGPSASEIAAGPPFAILPRGIEVAIVAGGSADGAGFNPLLAGNNDGVVTVAETALDGVESRLTVTALHTVIASDPQTIAATRHFLASGRLQPDAPYGNRQIGN